MPALTTTPAQNYARLRDRIAQLAPGRDITLVAVTKSVDAPQALELARAGALELGENRVDVLEDKAAAFQAAGVRVRWHYLGHLQTNKAKRLARVADVLHSLDSAELADKLEAELARGERCMDVFVQLKLTDEQAKTGLDPAELPMLVTHLERCPHLRLAGLMAMAPLAATDRAGAARDVFRRLKQTAAALETQLGRPMRCSMGMSEDFEIALAEGADVLRIGSLLFETEPA